MKHKSKGFAVFLAILILSAATLGGCTKPNAEDLAVKVLGEYAIEIADLGHKHTEFRADTSVKYEMEGGIFYEDYSISYKLSDDKHVLNTTDNRTSRLGVFALEEKTEYYYDGWYMNLTKTDGVTQTTLNPMQPRDALGGGNAFFNYMSVSGRYYMPTEYFDTNKLEGLAARKSGNRVVLTAAGKEDDLSEIRDAYFAVALIDTLATTPYSGSKGLASLDSITIEYIIKSNRIIHKTVVMTGQTKTVNDLGQNILVDARLTHQVDYFYTAAPEIRDELRDRAG